MTQKLLFASRGSQVPACLLGRADRTVAQREARVLAALRESECDGLVLDGAIDLRDSYGLIASVRRDFPLLPIVGRVRGDESEAMAAGLDGFVRDDASRGALEARVAVGRSRRWLRSRTMTLDSATVIVVSERPCERLTRALGAAAFRSVVCRGVDALLLHLRAQFSPILLIDLGLNEPLGEVLQAARRFDTRHAALGLLTNDGADAALTALREGASGYLHLEAGRAEVQYVMRRAWAQWLLGAGAPTDPLPCHALLIEDDDAHAHLITEVLGEAQPPWRVSRATRMETALHMVQSDPPDVVLLDLGLPDVRGLDTLVRFLASHPHVPVVVLSGDARAWQTAVEVGAEDFVSKDLLEGFGPRADDLRARVAFAVERRRARTRLMSRAQDIDAERTLPWLAMRGLDWPVAILDAQQRVAFVNAAFLRWTGRTEEDWLGTPAELTPTQDQSWYVAGLAGLDHPSHAQRLTLREGDHWVLSPASL